MKLIVRIVISLAVVATLFALGTYYYLFKAGDNQALEEILPANTLAYADIKHVRELGVDAARSELASTYEQLAKFGLGAFAAALSDQIEEESFPNGFPEINGEDMLKLGIYFNRQIAAAALPRESTDENKIAIPSLVTIAHFQGKEEGFIQELNTITEKINVKLEAKDHISWTFEDWNEVRIHSLVVPTTDDDSKYDSTEFDIPEYQICWAVKGTKFFASLDVASLKKLIEGSQTLAIEDSLASNASYQEIEKLDVTTDIGFFLNAAEFIPELVERIDQKILENKGPNELGISFSKLIEDLGVLAIDSIYSAIDFTPESEQSATGIKLNEKIGMWRLIKDGSAPLEAPTIAPSNIYSSNISTIDLGEMILWTKDLALKNAPIAAISYPEYKAQIDAFIGMDIEEFLDQSFSKELHMYSDIELASLDLGSGETMEIPKSSFLMVQGLGDATLFEDKIEELLAPIEAQGMVPIQVKESSGISYRFVDFSTQNPMPSAVELSYAMAITHNKLIFSYGSESLMTKALRNLSTGGPGAFAEERISDTFKQLPENECGIQLIDLNKIFNIFGSIAQTQLKKQAGSDPETAKMLDQIDWEAVKNLQLKIASKTYETETGFQSYSKIVPSGE